MATESTKAIRLLGLPQETTEDDLGRMIAELIKPDQQPFEFTLASQDAAKTATVTFQTSRGKNKAKEGKDKIQSLFQTTLDDRFLDHTVLYCPENSDLDICAVHGLNGNAFDTWMADNGRMWLRDFLPKNAPFNHSRIITFGYTSTLVDKRKLSERFEDYADQLIKRIILLRGSTTERRRPIIFVCHSMGGLVARLAMTRMSTMSKSDKFQGLCLSECGLLFLSTPHSGSIQAEQSQFLLALGEGLFGLRKGVVNELKLFNPSSADSIDIFKNMEVKPVIKCFCEGEPTRAMGKYFRVVDQVSAGFFNETAEKLLGTDHHTVCKFGDTHHGYRDVLDGMKKIRHDLLMRLAVGPQDDTNFGVPGTPNVTAHSFPPHEKHFLGVGRYQRSQFVERRVLDTILEHLNLPSQSVAVAGIGGIGKTELLREIASQRQGLQDVFFLPASSYEAFQKALSEMAQMIGHDILKNRHAYSELHQLWISLGESGQAKEFKNWLSSPHNHESLIILDDLDGLRGDEVIKECLPTGHKAVLYSARDPTLAESRLLHCKQVSIAAMDSIEIQELLEQQMKTKLASADLEGLLKIMAGHPLAASRAVSYIKQLAYECPDMNTASAVKLFIQSFETQDWDARKRFLQHRIHFGSSILEIFEVSIERLDIDKYPQILQLLELLGFICESKLQIDYNGFLSVERPWLNGFEAEMPDHELFALFTSGMRGTSELFQELEKVSLGFRPFPDRALLRFHPIWLECIRQRCGSEGRKRWIKQVLLICHETEKRNMKSEAMDPYVTNCVNISWAFNIELEQLLTGDSKRWISTMSKRRVVCT